MKQEPTNCHRSLRESRNGFFVGNHLTRETLVRTPNSFFLKRLSLLGHMRSKVQLRLICILVTRRGLFAFPPLQKLSKISQQTASVITKKCLRIRHSANLLKMNAIQTDENSFLNSPTVFEKLLLVNARMRLR